MQSPMVFDDNGLPILDQFSEEGFIDCIFKVANARGDDGFRCFDLLASHEGKTVGLSVRMVAEVGPGFDADMNLIREHCYRQGVGFRTLGPASDDLLTALARLYGLESGPLRMVAEETFNMIALQQGDTDLELHQVRMKLFGRDGEPFTADDYYESFFNLDLPNGLVAWNEKDTGYRAALIRALALQSTA